MTKSKLLGWSDFVDSVCLVSYDAICCWFTRDVLYIDILAADIILSIPETFPCADVNVGAGPCPERVLDSFCPNMPPLSTLGTLRTLHPLADRSGVKTAAGWRRADTKMDGEITWRSLLWAAQPTTTCCMRGARAWKYVISRLNSVKNINFGLDQKKIFWHTEKLYFGSLNIFV